MYADVESIEVEGPHHFQELARSDFIQARNVLNTGTKEAMALLAMRG